MMNAISTTRIMTKLVASSVSSCFSSVPLTMFIASLLLLAVMSVFPLPASACRPNPAFGALSAAWQTNPATMWETDEEERFHPYRTHGVEGTFMLMHHGASMLRLPDNEDGLEPYKESNLLSAVGEPENHGICMGIPDVFSRGAMIRLNSSGDSPGELASAAANAASSSQANGNAATQTTAGTPPTNDLEVQKDLWLAQKKHQIEQVLQPTGRFCNSLVTDINFWSPESLSTFELFSKWRSFLNKQRGIVLVLGPSAPDEGKLKRLLAGGGIGTGERSKEGGEHRPVESVPSSNGLDDGGFGQASQGPNEGQGPMVVARHVSNPGNWREQGPAVADDLQQFLGVKEGEKPPYSLMLVLGTPAEFAGFLGMRFHCTIPVVDGGELKVFPEDIWRESGVKSGWEEEDDSSDASTASLRGAKGGAANHSNTNQNLPDRATLKTKRYPTLAKFERENGMGVHAENQNQIAVEVDSAGDTAGSSSQDSDSFTRTLFGRKQRFLRRSSRDSNNANADPKSTPVHPLHPAASRPSPSSSTSKIDYNRIQSFNDDSWSAFAELIDGTKDERTQIAEEMILSFPEMYNNNQKDPREAVSEMRDNLYFMEAVLPRLVPEKMHKLTKETDSGVGLGIRRITGGIRVPFAPQSSASGVRVKIAADERLWYIRENVLIGEGIMNDSVATGPQTSLPPLPPHTRLHIVIDACDWRCEVWVDDERVGFHEGGYDSWVVDVTKFYNKRVRLLVSAWDPTDEKCEFIQHPPVPCINCCKLAMQPRGKQALNPGFIMYSPVTGLWRNGMWLQAAPACRVVDYTWFYDAQRKVLLVQEILLSEGCAARGDGRALLIDATLHRDTDDKVSHRGTLLPNGRETGYALHNRIQHALKGPDALRASTQPTLREQFAALEFRESDASDANGAFTEWTLDNPYLYRIEVRLSEVDDKELNGNPADGVWLGVRGEAGAGNEPGSGVLLYDGSKVDANSSKYTSFAPVDTLSRFIGLRQILMRRNQIYLNNKRVIIHGVLHQGYWPESLMTHPEIVETVETVAGTASTDSKHSKRRKNPQSTALWDDVMGIKRAGFNSVRVHMTVFPQEFYQACDAIGVLVMQDMPSGDGRVIPMWDMHRRNKQQDSENNIGYDQIVRTEHSQQGFLGELNAMITQLRSYTSVIVWVLFNEGWGQSKTLETVDMARTIDPTRLVDAVSGWNDPLLFGEPYPLVHYDAPLEHNKQQGSNVNYQGEEVPAPAFSPVQSHHVTTFSHDIGDFFDVHNYEGKPFQNLATTFDVYPFPIANRAVLVGEYGGIGFSANPQHEWDPHNSWAYGDVREKVEEFEDAYVKLLGPTEEQEREVEKVWRKWAVENGEGSSSISSSATPLTPQQIDSVVDDAASLFENQNSQDAAASAAIQNNPTPKTAFPGYLLEGDVTKLPKPTEKEPDPSDPLAQKKALGRLTQVFCNPKYSLVGAIYTQWTDVETEINGLMAYDRTEKIPLERLRELNERALRVWAMCSPPRWKGD